MVPYQFGYTVQDEVGGYTIAIAAYEDTSQWNVG